MTNNEIAKHFSLLADLMELHNENAFKIKSYAFAGRTLNKRNEALSTLTLDELENVEGIGKAIAAKILQLSQTGKLDLLENYLAKTPIGVVEMLQLKGIGPKKIAQLWKELEIESIGELEYACQENRLVELKGFGTKTQENILQQIQFLQQNAHKFLWANLEELSNEILAEIQNAYPEILVSTCGHYRRKSIIVERVDFIIATTQNEIQEALVEKYKQYPVHFYFCDAKHFYWNLLQLSSDKEHAGFLSFKTDTNKSFTSEREIYVEAGFPFIAPELRDNKYEWKLIEENNLHHLVELQDIKGIVHTHTKFSDGANSLAEMASYCKEQGFEYVVISDHSKSAFYANGMQEERIFQQHREIDKLNEQLAPFKIFKSIESDILYDGNLDYDDDILSTFDLIIASVHSQLKMNEERAMLRLIKAIENPYTTILGHLTGRLLLSRNGYPIDHQKIIDACAANKVSIELNANPYRLDIDYKWIAYCQEKNVPICINPDAHNLRGVHDIRYGVFAARKGGLLKANTLNTLTKDNFEKYLSHTKR